MKLRHQLLSHALSAAAIIFGLFGALMTGCLFQLQLTREVQALDARSASVVQSLEASAVNYALQNIALTDDMIADLLLQSDFSAGLYAPDGSPLCGSLPAQPPTEGLAVSSEGLTALRPVFLNGRTYYLLIKEDLTALYETRAFLLTAYATMYLILISLFALIMNLAARRISRPLEQLNEISLCLAKGDLAVRAKESSCAEIDSLAASFNTMADALTGQIERQQRFISDLTHEMKTPLTAIIGHADLIRSGRVSGEDALIASQQILSEGRRLNSLSARLIDLILLGQDELQLAELYAPRLIEDTSSAFAPEAERRSIRMTYAAEPAVLLCDAALIRALMSNLTDNAMKSGAGQIVLEGKQTDKGYVLCVRDDGRGMSAEELARISEPFYRVDKSRSRAQGGAGLGLTLCAEIARLHHTGLIFESTEGKGTSVSVIMNAKEAQEDA